MKRFEDYFWAVWLLIFMLLFFLAGRVTASAQSSVAVLGSASTGTNVGLSGPIVGVGGRAQLTSKRFFVIGEGFVLPYYPKVVGGAAGRAWSVQGEGRVRLFGDVFALGGVQRTVATFAGSGRTSTHVIVGGGYVLGNTQVSGYYLTPDHTRYKLQSVGVRIHSEIPFHYESKWVFVIQGGVEALFYHYPGTGEAIAGVKPFLQIGVGRKF